MYVKGYIVTIILQDTPCPSLPWSLPSQSISPSGILPDILKYDRKTLKLSPLHHHQHLKSFPDQRDALPPPQNPPWSLLCVRPLCVQLDPHSLLGQFGSFCSSCQCCCSYVVIVVVVIVRIFFAVIND